MDFKPWSARITRHVHVPMILNGFLSQYWCSWRNLYFEQMLMGLTSLIEKEISPTAPIMAEKWILSRGARALRDMCMYR